MTTEIRTERTLPTSDATITLSEVRLATPCASLLSFDGALVACGDDRARRREKGGSVTYRCLGRCGLHR